jgi:hypothetical protein
VVGLSVGCDDFVGSGVGATVGLPVGDAVCERTEKCTLPEIDESGAEVNVLPNNVGVNDRIPQLTVPSPFRSVS